MAAGVPLQHRRLRRERLGRHFADPELESLGGDLDENRVRLVGLGGKEAVIVGDFDLAWEIRPPTTISVAQRPAPPFVSQ
jgi:hypothetical protein